MAERILSRREFLKLIGYGGIALTLAPLLNFGGLGQLLRSNAPSASAQSAGSWSIGQNTTAVAIHAALLKSGKIFYLAGSGYHRDRPNGPFDARILDVNTGSEKNLPLTEDLFCTGLTQLENGNVLLAGGTLMYDDNPDNCNGTWHGLNSTYEVDADSETLVWVTSMAHGRWYPSLIALPDGKAVVVNGLDEYGSFNNLVEIYDPSTKTWSKKFDPQSNATYCVGRNANGTVMACPGAGSPCYGGPNNGTAPNIGNYPRMHLMPSGLVITCGGQATVRSWNPSTGRWVWPLALTSQVRSYGCSFLLPLHNVSSERGKIILVGGAVDSSTYSTSVVEMLDFDAGSSTNPVLRQVASIAHRRRELAPIILPNGKCVVFGGSEKGNTIPVRIPEAFDPVTETWEDYPAASVDRVYHQVSLLLPDGRVWTAGSTIRSNTEELRTEFFSPSYLFNGPRPVISGSPNVGGYGGTINISTPNASNISSVSLVRLMSCTHHYEANQRLVWLQILATGSNNITVSAPINANIAPPGFYMIHVLNGSGVPSVAKIIQIPGTGTGTSDTTSPSQVLGLTVTPISASRLDLAWTANTEPDLAHYNVYRGTSPGFAVNTATDTPLAQPATNSYSDTTGLTESTTYYYKVTAVDTSGNIGILSDEASGTPGDLAAPAKVLGLTVTPISASRLDLAWTANTEPDLGHYNVYRGTSPGFAVNTATDTPLAQPATNSYSNTGLSSSTTYYYKVAAVDTSSNIGILSDEASGTPGDLTAPAKVIGLVVTPISASRLDLAWTTNTEPDLGHYNVYRGTSPGFAVNTATDTPLAQPIANSYSDTTGLTESTTYYYKVAAVDTSSNIGILSDEASGATGDSTAPAKVLGLTVTPISASRLDLAWTANTEPDLGHYNVYRGTSPGFAVNTATDTPLAQPATNSYSDTTGLTESTTYYYKVAAVDTTGNIGILSDEASGTPGDLTAPAKVIGLVVTPISASRLDLAWTTNTEPDLGHYNVYRGTSPGFAVNTATDTPLAQPATNSYSDTTGLTESTTYYYKVAAVDTSSNIGILSDEASGATGDSTAPAKVLGLTVTPISATRLDLAWTANTEPDLGHYNVYRGTSPGFAVNTATDTPLAQPATNSYSDTTGLTESTTYYYKVAAVDTSSNIGILSDEASATAGGIFYDVAIPGNKAVAINVGGSTRFGEEALNTSSVIVGKPLKSWKVRLRKSGTPSGLISAKIRRQSDDAIVATFNETINSTTLGTAFAEYTFTLTNPYTIQSKDRIMIEYGGPAAVNIEIWTADKFDGSNTRRIRYDGTGYVGGNSEDVSGTMSSLAPTGSGGDTTPPTKVIGLVVTPISATRLDLAWTANTEPDLGHYNVYRGTTSGFPVNTATDTPLAQPSTNSYSNTGLSSSTTYYYKVAAVDTTGNIGILSDEASGTPGDLTAPAKVIGLVVTPISATRLDLAWTANTEPDLGHYNVYRGTTPGFPVNTATDTPLAQPATNSYSNTGLSSSTTYYYKVAAVDTTGNIGILSDEASGTPGDLAAPAKVIGLVVTPISATRLDLAWTANTEPDLGHYNVYRGTTSGFPVNTATDTPLAQPATNSYSDNSGLVQSTTYYYKVAAVDTSGNIGILSDQFSATTLTQVFYDVAIPGNKAAVINTGVTTRYGEEALNASSILVGKSLKSWKVRLRKSGTPSGLISAKIRRQSDDAIVATFNETIDSTTLGTTFAEYTFTLTNPYTIQSKDRIMVEYGGPAAVNIEIWNVDKFDGGNTRRTRYDGTSYIGSNTEEVTGTMSTA